MWMRIEGRGKQAAEEYANNVCASITWKNNIEKYNLYGSHEQSFRARAQPLFILPAENRTEQNRRVESCPHRLSLIKSYDNVVSKCYCAVFCCATKAAGATFR